MFEKKHFASLLPMRLPHWRLNRVMEMLRHRPKPLVARWEDDYPIRAYRRMLLGLMSAGDDEEKLGVAIAELPAVYEAHRYHYSADFQARQEIEARLLTRASLEEIASKLGADPQAIEYYASLFFDVRDALDLSGWVAPMIRIRMRYDEQCGCSRAEAERGYVVRLFGYFGGPLVLDALITPLGESKPPANAQEIRAWSEEAVTQIIRAMGTAAAASLEFSGAKKMQLIRLAKRQMREGKTNSGREDDNLNRRLEATLSCFEKL